MESVSRVLRQSQGRHDYKAICSSIFVTITDSSERFSISNLQVSPKYLGNYYDNYQMGHLMEKQMAQPHGPRNDRLHINYGQVKREGSFCLLQ